MAQTLFKAHPSACRGWVVYKYELTKWESQYEALIPPSAKVLRIDSQAGKICLWALVDPMEFKTLRRFDVFGTGHPIPSDGQERVFVNTFLMHEGTYVFHAFEVISQ